MDWDAWVEEVHLAKQEFARLINASADEIAVFSSVSEATSAVASAIDFGGGRRRSRRHRGGVSDDWPRLARAGAARRARDVGAGARRRDRSRSVRRARRRAHGARVGVPRLLPERLHAGHSARSPSARTRAGALLYVDAYQTLGTQPVDVRAMDVDFLAAGNLKFLMGIPGIAFLYVRRELIERLSPTITGWFGRANPFAFQVKQLDWSPTAARFDTGTPPVVNAYISRAGMSIINEVGPTAFARGWKCSAAG